MRRFWSLVVNGLIASAVWGVASRTLWAKGAEGLQYLRFFTVQSNLMMGLTALIYLLTRQLALCGVLRRVPRWVRGMKLVFTSTLGLTLLVVLFYLVPVQGIAGKFSGGNFWFHLVLPVAALADWCLLDDSGPVPAAAVAVSGLPVTLYGAAYLSNLIRNGYGGRGHPNDWYAFAEGGGPLVPVLLVAMIALNVLIAWLLRRARMREHGRDGAKAATPEKR